MQVVVGRETAWRDRLARLLVSRTRRATIRHY